MRNDACGLPLKKEKTMMLRKTQNQNDADDANDAESGIWYRDILKTASLASQASSASLSSRKNSAGVWGTPQKCVCGYPNAMLAKHVYPKTMTNKPDTRTNPDMLSRVNHFWFIQKSWLEKVNPFWFTPRDRGICFYLSSVYKADKQHNDLLKIRKIICIILIR